MERIRAPVGYQGGNWEPRATGDAARACGDVDDGVARDGQAMRLDLHEFAELVRDLEERISREELTPPDHRNAAGAHSDGGPNALIPRRPPHGHQRVGGGATR